MPALICLFFLALPAVAQTTSSRLIDFLTYREYRSNRITALLGAFSCGMDHEDREAAVALSALGTRALPDIHRVLTSLEQFGSKSPFALNAKWVLFAYAKIDEPSATAELLRMKNSTKLAFLRSDLDVALALSLKLSGYVTFPEPGTKQTQVHSASLREFICYGADPRDTMRRVISAWGTNNRVAIEHT